MGIEEIRKLKNGTSVPKQPKKYTIPKKSAKKLKQEAEEKSQRVNGVTPLQLWYEEIMKSEDKQCWNCGISLSGYNKQDWHACIAHVLPKSQFPSVATHPLNYMILGNGVIVMVRMIVTGVPLPRMPIFKEAMQRFIILEPDIKEKVKFHLFSDMTTAIKVTYVALNEWGKPIMSASTFNDLRKGLDDYYAVDRTDAKCIGFVPFESKYPDEYEGHYTYTYTTIVRDQNFTETDVIKVYCIDYWPHTIYEV